MTKIPPDDVLESLYKLRTHESDQLRTVLELYDIKNHQKISMPNYQKIEDDGEKKHRSETSITPETRCSRQQWLRVAGDQVAFNGEKKFAISGKQKGQCSIGDQCSFGRDVYERAQPTPKTAPPCEPLTPRGTSASRKRSFRGGSLGRPNRQPCTDFLRGICTAIPCAGKSPAMDPLIEILRTVVEEAEFAPGQACEDFHLQEETTHAAAMDRLHARDGYAHRNSRGWPLVVSTVGSDWNMGPVQVHQLPTPSRRREWRAGSVRDHA